jgi:hypothetical protein
MRFRYGEHLSAPDHGASIPAQAVGRDPSAACRHPRGPEEIRPYPRDFRRIIPLSPSGELIRRASPLRGAANSSNASHSAEANQQHRPSRRLRCGQGVPRPGQ